jgi:hypothetical protein
MPAYPVADVLTLEQSLAAPYLPGFQAGEQVIAKAWLADAGRAYEAFAYNVRVGQGATPAEDVPDFAKRFVTKVTQKRIDLVAFRGGRAALLEVKIQANLGALGQMLGYLHLWEKQFPAWPVNSYGIICHLISLDTASVYVKHGMPYFVFSDIQLPPLPTLPPG